jgi:hypothetical protein
MEVVASGRRIRGTLFANVGDSDSDTLNQHVLPWALSCKAPAQWLNVVSSGRWTLQWVASTWSHGQAGALAKPNLMPILGRLESAYRWTSLNLLRPRGHWLAARLLERGEKRDVEGGAHGKPAALY